MPASRRGSRHCCPSGARARQLLVRTLLGMLLVPADHRPAHLTRVRQTLVSRPGDDQARLGIIAEWKNGLHLLSYRQTERPFGLVADALAGDEPDGLPSDILTGICDDLLEASIPDQFSGARASLAVDWTDLETFSRPPLETHYVFRIALLRCPACWPKGWLPVGTRPMRLN